jgi:hypothetical protein
MKKILLLILLLAINCATVNKNQISSAQGEDMMCDEEDARNCKYQFENY